MHVQNIKSMHVKLCFATHYYVLSNLNPMQYIKLFLKVMHTTLKPLCLKLILRKNLL